MDNFFIKQPRSSSGPSVSSHVAPEAQRETITASSSNVDCILGNEFESRGNAGKSFTQDDFKNWKHGPERIQLHVGEVNSIYNKCLNRMLDFANQRQLIHSSLHKQSEKTKSDYRIRLNASIDVVRFLLRNRLSFRGHDESENSDYS
ncbi:hypothetical protein H5410_039320 [Solanum commersonii]|uniref:DUF4371 domain-containing protein n=1 Tax=Solanum commersonii TaxID=4109 RepID=A0A9J5YEP0_SOLCO|nr:hypothetical protein H5410_039320 [Solanum commersonii]